MCRTSPVSLDTAIFSLFLQSPTTGWLGQGLLDLFYLRIIPTWLRCASLVLLGQHDGVVVGAQLTLLPRLLDVRPRLKARLCASDTCPRQPLAR